MNKHRYRSDHDQSTDLVLQKHDIADDPEMRGSHRLYTTNGAGRCHGMGYG